MKTQLLHIAPARADGGFLMLLVERVPVFDGKFYKVFSLDDADKAIAEQRSLKSLDPRDIGQGEVRLLEMLAQSSRFLNVTSPQRMQLLSTRHALNHEVAA